MKGIALSRAVLAFACCLFAAGCYSTYRVRPGLDDLYIYAPGQEERAFELEQERDYAPGAEGRRLRVSDSGRNIEVWIGPLRVSGKAHVVVNVKPGGLQGSLEAVAGNFRQFWDGHRAELEGALGAAARDEFVTALKQKLEDSGDLPAGAMATLEERFGLKEFDAARAQIDLQPGMRLRVETSVFQRPLGDATSEQGFVAAETRYYLISRRPDRKITFEPFVALLDRMGKAPEILRSNGSEEDNFYFAPSALDLLSKDKEFSLYRVIYPKEFSNSFDMASDAKEQMVVLVGADCPKFLHWQKGDSFQEEEGKPQKCLYDDEAKKQHCPDPQGGPCRFVSRFRGRAMVIPEIPVSVNGEPVWISVGTTLRNVVGPFRDLSAPGSLSTFQLFRRSGNTYARVDLSAAGRECVRVVNGAPISEVCDPFDLPLLAGDRIVLVGGY